MRSSQHLAIIASLIALLNGLSNAAPSLSAAVPPAHQVATIAGGCFWAMEARFKLLKGVESVTPGYAGGHTANPTYEQVCSDTTGYAEAVQIVFDPKVLNYHDLIDIFMHVHNPTTIDRQGNDVGNSYRSEIFCHGSEQEAIARAVVRSIEAKHVWPNPVVTRVTQFTNFYPAEAYHVDYFAHHPENSYCQVVVTPEVASFRQRYAALLKTR